MLSLVIPSSSLLDQDPSRCIQSRDKQSTYSLPNLVKDIKSYLGNNSGIDSSSIDEDYLISLLRKYVSNPNDWFRYFYNDYSKNYTRNTIENINQKANIVSLSTHQPIKKIDLTLENTASSRVESRQGLPDPRPCKRSLHHEGPRGRVGRDGL